MKKICILMIAVAAKSTVQGQSDSSFATVRYTFIHVVDTTQADRPNSTAMVLHLGKTISNYTRYRASQKNKNDGSAVSFTVNGQAVAANVISGGVSSEGTVMTNMADLKTIYNCYKNFALSKLSLIDLVGTKIFAVEEDIPSINWSITEETKDIMGLHCQKATADFKGRSYEAWFCSQLPYSNGPWKLGGLPGLILEASDTKKEVVFKFVSFENIAGQQSLIELPVTAVRATPKEFRQYKSALEKNSDANAGANSSSMIFVRPTGTLSPAGGKPEKPLQLNNPIEKEL